MDEFQRGIIFGVAIMAIPVTIALIAWVYAVICNQKLHQDWNEAEDNLARCEADLSNVVAAMETAQSESEEAQTELAKAHAELEEERDLSMEQTLQLFEARQSTPPVEPHTIRMITHRNGEAVNSVLSFRRR